MEIYQLKIKQYLIIIIMGLPIGLTLYYINSPKITYLFNLSPGVAIATQFCDNVNYVKENLYSTSELNEIINNTNLSNNTKYKIKKADNSMYTIEVKSKLGEDDLVNKEFNVISEKISLLENAKFENFFKNSTLNCVNSKYQIYEFKPSQLRKSDKVFKRYSTFHLALLLLLPVIIIWLIIISFRYIKKTNASNGNPP
jgi:hypothetical protein